MRYPRKWQLAVVCLLALALLPFAPAPRGTAQAPGYTVTDLGALGTGEVSRAHGLNECGRVVGESTLTPSNSTDTHPFLWSEGTMTDLGTLGGATGTAAAINQGGSVVGSALTAVSLPHAFIRPPGGPMQDLGTLGGFTVDAQDVNASGQVVGQSEDGSFQDRAFIWQSGTMTALTAPWGTPIRALGINDAGQVAGNANVTGVVETHAFVTINGVAVDIGTLGGSVSFANEVNDLGEVAGQSYIFSATITQSFHAFRWKDTNGSGASDPGEMQDLGTLGGRHSYAYDLNNNGLVVGRSETVMGSSDTHAFIWSSAGGGMQDLNTVASGTGWTFHEARGINDRGQIVGTGLNPAGKVHAFLLTPTNVGPSPCDPTPTPTPVPGTLQFSAANYSVGESGGSVIISVSRTGGIDGAVSVGYATSTGGTATAGTDYTATSGTLNFAAGETTKTFPVTIADDTLDESDETVNLALSTPGGGATLGSQSTAVLTITDDDAQPTVQFSAATYTVGESGGSATITVTRTGGTNGGVTVGYATSNGTATTAGNDYTAASGTLTFAAGDNSESFTVPINNDTLDEPDETINLSLSSPGGGGALGSQITAVLTITDDDVSTLSVGDLPVLEGNSGTTNASFTVALSAASWQTVTVNYTVNDGTATRPADYTVTSATGTLTFNPGETSKSVNFAVVGDTTNEVNENFNLTISNATNATIADDAGICTILDDDGPPSLSVNDVTVTEGNAGTTAATFTVTLLPVSGQSVTVNYATANGTATTANNDYASTSGTLTFDPGQTSKTVTVNVNGDTTPEAHETFFVNLSGESNATVTDAQGQGTINNDDTAIAINDVTASEGNAGNTAFTFTVSLSHVTVNAVSVGYATSDGTATVSNSDYTATSGTLNFAAGETSKTITVNVTGDTLFENSESFNVTLSTPTNATISDNTGVGTINNDDTAPSFSINDVTVTEGNAGTTAATFTVNLSAASGLASSVSYATANGTATGGTDYTAINTTALNFAAGETSKTVTVNVNGDTTPEAHETFFVNLSGATGATISDTQGQGTINNDDTSLSINDVTAGEGNSGTTSFTFTVSLSHVTVNTVTVNYATADGTAVAPGDYTAIASTALTFNPGETTKNVVVSVVGDTIYESNETFNVNLSGATGAAVSDGTGLGTITNDETDSTFQFSAATYSVAESGGTATITVNRTGTAGGVSVGYATSNGTATAGSEYTAASGTLNFAAGEASKTFTVTIADDTLDEPDKSLNLALSSPVGGSLGAQSTATLTITDDDGAPALSVGDVTVTEGDSGNTAATLNVTLAPASGQTVTVNYASADGTANAGPDYGSTAGTLTFAPGETTKTITVNVFGDTINESNETFFVNLSAASNATVADAQGQGTINNDDTPTLRFSQATYPIGESAHFVTVTVTRTGDPTPAVGVRFATSDGTATERKDYTAVSGRLQFAAGETSKTFDVLLTEDAFTESEETINLTLSNPTGVSTLGSQSTATVNIAADDNPPPGFNPIDISSDFVRQHYHDFLNREPDASGLAFWTGEIEQCGADAGCREVKRINVSAAFFLSIEFQQTGYLVYRTYKAAYGDATSPNVEGTVPVVRLQEFLPDTRSIGEGVVVGQPNWEQKLEANKNAYMAEFVQRTRFTTEYPVSLTAAQFVDKLNLNAGSVLTQAERDQLVAQLSPNPAAESARASVLRSVSENAALQQNEFRRAFVLMQFYGYLRRNPDDPQDVDFRGWKFWLDKLNQFNGNYIQAEMVKAFLDSIEYRTRFAP